MLTTEELEYYNRQLVLSGFGSETQEKLKRAKVLVVGAGGLGCPVLSYLIAAGVGELGIIDGDTVHLSNLHRQVLYSVKDVGKPKAEIARKKLLAQNNFIKINAYVERLTLENVDELFSRYGLIVDCTDNLGSRYLINDYSIKYKKPFVYGSIYKYEGMVSVFNYLNNEEENNVSYRDLFPSTHVKNVVPNCETTGVIGVLPGIIGSMQANEAIKIITGIGIPLIGKLFTFDALTMTSQLVRIRKSDKPFEINLEDYLIGCDGVNDVREITPKEFYDIISSGVEYQIIDLRENGREPVHPKALLLPYNQLEDNLDSISRSKQVVICCNKGITSAKAVELLENKYKFNNLYSLKGGVEALANNL